jgi:hypothetical protein
VMGSALWDPKAVQRSVVDYMQMALGRGSPLYAAFDAAKDSITQTASIAGGVPTTADAMISIADLLATGGYGSWRMV